MVEPLIDIKEVAKRIGISVRHVNELKSQRKIPYIKLSEKCVRYRWSDIERALEDLTIHEHGSNKMRRAAK